MKMLKKAVSVISVLLIFAAMATGCTTGNSTATTAPAATSAVAETTTAPAEETSTEPSAETSTEPTVDPATSETSAAPAGTDGACALPGGASVTLKGTVTPAGVTDTTSTYTSTDGATTYSVTAVKDPSLASADQTIMDTFSQGYTTAYASMEGSETKDGTHTINGKEVKTKIMTGTLQGASTYVEYGFIGDMFVIVTASSTDAAAVGAAGDVFKSIVVPA